MTAAKALLDGGAVVFIMVRNGLTPRAVAQKDKGGIMKILEGGAVPIFFFPYDGRVIDA